MWPRPDETKGGSLLSGQFVISLLNRELKIDFFILTVNPPHGLPRGGFNFLEAYFGQVPEFLAQVLHLVRMVSGGCPR